MYIARWRFAVKFGCMDQALEALRQWEIDVGERIGWRVGSIRVTVGVIGESTSNIEYEVPADSLSEIESAWRAAEEVPHNRGAMEQLARYIVEGSDGWTVHRVVDMAIG